MNVVLLIVVLASVVAGGLQMLPLAERYKLPGMLSALLWGSFLTFIGSLVAGAIGAYAPYPVAGVIVAISCLSIFSLWKVAGIFPQIPQLQIDFASFKKGPWNAVSVIISVVSLLACYPYAECFAKLFQLLFSPAAELGWDAVSYHLPALIEFIQAHSFWTFEGPYQSYSYGFELIYGLSILFCHAHWSVVIGHGLSVVLMLLSTAYLTKLLLDTLDSCGINNVNRIMVHLLVQAIWAGVIFRTSLDGVGNNDVFEAATLIASFSYFLDLSRRDQTDAVPRKLLLFLGASTYAMALATKSPALLFAPLLTLMSVCVKAENKLGFKFAVAEALKVVPVLTVSMAVGTFFLWHNISKFGGICDPDLACGFRDTLLHHLRDPRLFKPTLGSGMFFGSSITLLFFAGVWQACVKNARRNVGAAGAAGAAPFVWLLGLYLTGAAAFSYTPFGVTPDFDHNDLTRLFFQDRKAMVMYMVTSLFIALSVGSLLTRLTKSESKSLTDNSRTNAQSRLIIPQGVATILLACLFVSMPAINWWWHRDWPIGLEGYEVVKGLPRTNVYRWVQNLDSGKRIYASGLRPYGLFGRDYDNHLFYDLHSHILKTEKQSRLLTVLDRFHPDIILISVDPHAYTGGPQKPDLVEWMKLQPCFSSVYEDETVSGFRVKDGWREALQKYKLLDQPLRMHS